MRPDSVITPVLSVPTPNSTWTFPALHLLPLGRSSTLVHSFGARRRGVWPPWKVQRVVVTSTKRKEIPSKNESGKVSKSTFLLTSRTKLPSHQLSYSSFNFIWMKNSSSVKTNSFTLNLQKRTWEDITYQDHIYFGKFSRKERQFLVFSDVLRYTTGKLSFVKNRSWRDTWSFSSKSRGWEDLRTQNKQTNEKGLV